MDHFESIQFILKHLRETKGEWIVNHCGRLRMISDKGLCPITSAEGEGRNCFDFLASAGKLKIPHETAVYIAHCADRDKGEYLRELMLKEAGLL